MNEQKKPFDAFPPPSSEDLDQPLMVVSTKNWLALFAILLLTTLSILWLIFGSIPVVVNGQAFFWQIDDEKVIYGALSVEMGQKVGENFPVLMHVSAVNQQENKLLKGKVIKNFMTPMGLAELEKNIPDPNLASFLMGKNQDVVLIKIQPLQEIPKAFISGNTGTISIQIATLKPIQYVVPTWGVQD